MYVPTLCLVPFSFSVWVFFIRNFANLRGNFSTEPPKKKRRLDILPFEDSGTNLLPGDVRAHVPGA